MFSSGEGEQGRRWPPASLERPLGQGPDPVRKALARRPQGSSVLGPRRGNAVPGFRFSTRLRCAGLGDPGLVTETASRHLSVQQPLAPFSRAEASGCRGVAWAGAGGPHVEASPSPTVPSPRQVQVGRRRHPGGAAAVATQSDCEPPDSLSAPHAARAGGRRRNLAGSPSTPIGCLD